MQLTKFFKLTLISVTFFLCDLFCLRNTPQEVFDGILLSIQHACEVKSKNDIDQDFQDLITDASEQFKKINSELTNGCEFIEYTYIYDDFRALLKNIRKVDKSILKNSRLKITHLNSLIKCVRNLRIASKLQIKESDHFQRQHLAKICKDIEEFYDIVNRIYKKSYCVISSRVERVCEFLKDHWKVGLGIVGTTVAVKVAYDMRNYKGQYDKSNDYSKYRKLLSGLILMGLGSLFGSNILLDNSVMTSDGILVEGSILRSKDTKVSVKRRINHGEIRFFDQSDNSTRNWRDNKNITLEGETEGKDFDFNCQIITHPCVRQSGGTCGYHALFNAAHMFNENYEELIKREECINKISEWRKVVEHNNWIHKEDMETIFKSNDSLLSGKIFNSNNFNLIENVSIIELPEIMRKLDDMSRTIYEIKYNSSQHDSLYSIVGMKRNLRTITKSDGSTEERSEYLFSGKPSKLIPGMHSESNQQNAIDKTIIRNIKNFRDNRTAQIIILNTGSHWIAVRLETKNGQDYITVADSSGNGYEGSCINSIQKLYYLFKHAPLDASQSS